jgi:lambda family phage minor tail protein L
MMESNFAGHVQALSLDAYIELFDLDATALGGTFYRFVSSSLSDNAVTWQGNVYTPIPVEATGFEVSGKGTLPTPHIKIANVNLAFSAVAIAYGDLLGCKLTRHRTFQMFLDGQPDADPEAELVDFFRIERKAAQNKIYVEWELAAWIDQQGAQIPGRQVLQDACTHLYRFWNGSAFDYSKATCPYTGTDYFDVNGNPVASASLDIPGRHIANCCKLRFPGQPLPTRAFPGVAQSQLT